MGKHHHHNRRSEATSNNGNILNGLGEFLSHININQLASLVQALNLKSVDTSQLTSLISKLGIGNLTGTQLGPLLASKQEKKEPITLNSLGDLGLLNKQELNNLLARMGEGANKANGSDGEVDAKQQEGVNEVMGAIKNLLGNLDSNQLMGLLSTLNLNNDKK